MCSKQQALRADYGLSILMGRAGLSSWPAVRRPLVMRRKRTKFSRKIAWTKVRLTLPDLDQAKAAVLRSLRSPESQRGYRHAIDEFIAWYCSEPRLSFNRAVVSRYKADLESRQLAPGTVNALCYGGPPQGVRPRQEVQTAHGVRPPRKVRRGRSPRGAFPFGFPPTAPAIKPRRAGLAAEQL